MLLHPSVCTTDSCKVTLHAHLRYTLLNVIDVSGHGSTIDMHCLKGCLGEQIVVLLFVLRVAMYPGH